MYSSHSCGRPAAGEGIYDDVNVNLRHANLIYHLGQSTDTVLTVADKKHRVALVSSLAIELSPLAILRGRLFVRGHCGGTVLKARSLVIHSPVFKIKMGVPGCL